MRANLGVLGFFALFPLIAYADDWAPPAKDSCEQWTITAGEQWERAAVDMRVNPIRQTAAPVKFGGKIMNSGDGWLLVQNGNDNARIKIAGSTVIYKAEHIRVGSFIDGAGRVSGAESVPLTDGTQTKIPVIAAACLEPGGILDWEIAAARAKAIREKAAQAAAAISVAPLTPAEYTDPNWDGLPDSYKNSVSLAIHYPSKAAREGSEGQCTIRIAFDRSGTLLKVDLKERSGIRELDSECVDAVMRTGKFPVVDPKILPGKERFDVVARINFHLDDSPISTKVTVH